jgi:hypothetical protein
LESLESDAKMLPIYYMWINATCHVINIASLPRFRITSFNNLMWTQCSFRQLFSICQRKESLPILLGNSISPRFKHKNRNSQMDVWQHSKWKTKPQTLRSKIWTALIYSLKYSQKKKIWTIAFWGRSSERIRKEGD